MPDNRYRNRREIASLGALRSEETDVFGLGGPWSRYFLPNSTKHRPLAQLPPQLAMLSNRRRNLRSYCRKEHHLELQINQGAEVVSARLGERQNSGLPQMWVWPSGLGGRRKDRVGGKGCGLREGSSNCMGGTFQRAVGAGPTSGG